MKPTTKYFKAATHDRVHVCSPDGCTELPLNPNGTAKTLLLRPEGHGRRIQLAEGEEGIEWLKVTDWRDIDIFDHDLEAK